MPKVPLSVGDQPFESSFLEVFPEFLPANASIEALVGLLQAEVEERPPPHQHETPGVIGEGNGPIRVDCAILEGQLLA
jgi:hypothetical protein